MRSAFASAIRREQCGLPVQNRDSSDAKNNNDLSPITRSDGDHGPAGGDDGESTRASARARAGNDDRAEEAEEDALMEDASRQVRWLMRRLATTIKSGDDDGEGGGEAKDSEDGIFDRIFGGRRAADAIIAADDPSDPAAGTSMRLHSECNWTMFDLQRIANRCDDLLGDDILPSLLASLEEKDESFVGTGGSDREDIRERWVRMVNPMRFDQTYRATVTWEDILLLPHRNASSRILSMYDPDNNRDKRAIHDYLCYHAARTIEHMEQFALPSLRRRLAEQEEHHRRQQERHEHLVRMNNDAFERWDDYCTDIFGVESDSLPLFPDINYDDTKATTDSIVDEYATDVGNSVVDSMRSEFERLAKRFLQSLSNADDAPGDGSKNHAGAVVKCRGRDIAEAISYCRHYTAFLSAASGSTTNATQGEQHYESLSTLCRFVTYAQTSDTSLLSQFIESPIARAEIVGDLRLLEAFLSSRKRELSSRSSSSARGGRDVIEDISLQWTQYCLRKAATSTHRQQHPRSSLSLEDISLDDVTRFLDAVRGVSAQIAREGSQAGRLRFLADSVGLPTNDDVIRGSLMLQCTCRNGAFLARKMTLYQDWQETSSKTVVSCAAAIGRTKEDISDVECRAKEIRERFSNANGAT